MNPFRAIGKAWRRWRLRASPPPCPCCPGISTVVLADPGKPAQWRCNDCQAVWWQYRPGVYGMESWGTAEKPPDYAVAPQVEPHEHEVRGVFEDGKFIPLEEWKKGHWGARGPCGPDCTGPDHGCGAECTPAKQEHTPTVGEAAKIMLPKGRWTPETWRKIMHPDKHE